MCMITHFICVTTRTPWEKNIKLPRKNGVTSQMICVISQNIGMISQNNVVIFGVPWLTPSEPIHSMYNFVLQKRNNSKPQILSMEATQQQKYYPLLRAHV